MTKTQRWLKDFFTLGPEDTKHPKIAKFFRRNFWVNTGDLVSWHFGDSFVSVDTILPVYVSTITNSSVVIGLVRALWDAGWFLPQLFLAPRVEKRSRQLPLVKLLGVFERLPYLVIGFAILWFPSLPAKMVVIVFMILYIWKSFTAGFVALPWQEMIARVIPVSRRGRFVGFSHILGRLMGVAGGILAGMIIKELPYPRNFATLFFIAFVGVSISWLFLSMNKEPHIKKETVETVEQNHYFKRLKSILSNDHNFRNYVISRGLAYVGLMAQGFIAVFVIQHYGLSEDYAGIFTAIILGSGAIGFAIWGIMGDRVGYKRVMMISILIRIAVLILFIFSPSLVWIYVAFGLMGIGNTASMTSDFNIAMEFGTESERPTYIGLARTLTGPILLVAPLIAGAITDVWGYPAMFVTSLIFTAAGLVMLGLGVKDPRNIEVGV